MRHFVALGGPLKEAARTGVHLFVQQTQPAKVDKKRVLVIDDDPSIRALVVGMLSQKYTVEQAPDGKAALSMFQSGSTFHAVVCDVMMPNLGGFDFARQLRSSGRAPPIVFITARISAMDVVEGINAGAKFYIAKPFKMDELLDKVSRAVR